MFEKLQDVDCETFGYLSMVRGEFSEFGEVFFHVKIFIYKYQGKS